MRHFLVVVMLMVSFSCKLRQSSKDSSSDGKSQHESSKSEHSEQSFENTGNVSNDSQMPYENIYEQLTPTEKENIIPQDLFESDQKSRKEANAYCFHPGGFPLITIFAGCDGERCPASTPLQSCFPCFSSKCPVQ